MTRPRTIALLAAAAAALAPAAAQASAPAPAAAQLVSCHRSPNAAARVAVVGATMRPLAGSMRLDLRVDLYERPLAGGRWTLRSDVPGLGSWISPSDPTLGSRARDVFKYRQAVGRLDVPDQYRFRVGFRWLDDDGKIVRETSAVTHACRQPDVRPNLTIVHVATHASKRMPGLVRYRVLVRNDGRSPARGVVLSATFPGGGSGARLARIDPGQSVELDFTNDGCAAGDLAGPSFVVDPANLVDEVDEADNALALACPVP